MILLILDNEVIVNKLLTAGAYPNTIYNETTNVGAKLFGAIFSGNTIFLLNY